MKRDARVYRDVCQQRGLAYGGNEAMPTDDGLQDELEDDSHLWVDC